MVKRCLGVLLVLAAASLGPPATAQQPSVRASVDRSTVHENESFTYVLHAEGQVHGQPDVSPLEGDFEVLDQSSTTRLQIMNGKASQIAEWSFQLMPRKSGRFTLPSINLGGARSNPVDIEVLPAVASTGAPGDIFIEVQATPTKVYVQSQVVYTLRVFRGVATGRATLSSPTTSGGEAIVEQLGQDREYQTVRNGRDFMVRERRYAVLPQEAGKLVIKPVTFEAVVASRSGFSSLQRFRSKPIELQVRGPVPPPASFPNAVWLPARNLTLTEKWSADPSRMNVGEPLTRTLTVQADGVLETQFPEFHPGQSEHLKQYADQPELGHEDAENGLRSRRTERFAVIAQAPGAIDVPGVRLPWWNVAKERWEVARIEPRTVQALPGAQRQANPPAGMANAAATPAPAVPRHEMLWQQVSALLLVIWIATLALWWQTRRRPPTLAPSPGVAGPRRATNRRLLRQLRDACRADDARRAHRLLLEWGALRFGEGAPLTLAALAARLPDGLAAQARSLEASLYGPAAGTWRGAGLERALASVDSVARAEPGSRSEDLLPLYR
jgi:hypothetical protein